VLAGVEKERDAAVERKLALLEQIKDLSMTNKDLERDNATILLTNKALTDSLRAKTEAAQHPLELMNTPEIELIEVSPAFVLGVAHTIYQVLGERMPGEWITGPTGHRFYRRGPLKRAPGFAVGHPFAPGEEEEYQYDQGRVFAAQKLQEEVQAAEAKANEAHAN
jgi:hypothetical protein